MNKSTTAIFITLLLLGTAAFLYLNAISGQDHLDIDLEDEDVSSYC
ncbi:MAG: hypothetical protein M3142_09220 [Bacteroidota bacterium]|nr:hypothetical protein [Bacteroidota bacterium]